MTFPFHASRFRYKEKFWFTKSCEKDPNNLVYNRILYSVPFLLTSQYLGTIPWPLVFFKSLRIAFSKMILTTLKIFGSTLQCQKKLTQTERIQILFSSHFCIRNFNKVCNWIYSTSKAQNLYSITIPDFFQLGKKNKIKYWRHFRGVLTIKSWHSSQEIDFLQKLWEGFDLGFPCKIFTFHLRPIYNTAYRWEHST